MPSSMITPRPKMSAGAASFIPLGELGSSTPNPPGRRPAAAPKTSTFKAAAGRASAPGSKRPRSKRRTPKLSSAPAQAKKATTPRTVRVVTVPKGKRQSTGSQLIEQAITERKRNPFIQTFVKEMHAIGQKEWALSLYIRQYLGTHMQNAIIPALQAIARFNTKGRKGTIDLPKHVQGLFSYQGMQFKLDDLPSLLELWTGIVDWTNGINGMKAADIEKLTNMLCLYGQFLEALASCDVSISSVIENFGELIYYTSERSTQSEQLKRQLLNTVLSQNSPSQNTVLLMGLFGVEKGASTSWAEQLNPKKTASASQEDITMHRLGVIKGWKSSFELLMEHRRTSACRDYFIKMIQEVAEAELKDEEQQAFDKLTRRVSLYIIAVAGSKREIVSILDKRNPFIGRFIETLNPAFIDNWTVDAFCDRFSEINYCLERLLHFGEKETCIDTVSEWLSCLNEDVLAIALGILLGGLDQIEGKDNTDKHLKLVRLMCMHYTLLMKCGTGNPVSNFIFIQSSIEMATPLLLPNTSREQWLLLNQIIRGQISGDNEGLQEVGELNFLADMLVSASDKGVFEATQDADDIQEVGPQQLIAKLSKHIHSLTQSSSGGAPVRRRRARPTATSGASASAAAASDGEDKTIKENLISRGKIIIRTRQDQCMLTAPLHFVKLSGASTRGKNLWGTIDPSTKIDLEALKRFQTLLNNGQIREKGSIASFGENQLKLRMAHSDKCLVGTTIKGDSLIIEALMKLEGLNDQDYATWLLKEMKQHETSKSVAMLCLFNEEGVHASSKGRGPVVKRRGRPTPKRLGPIL